tara:strand:+ start:544 stop:777 length:234 start_codon:yes stop_codon:yes gene_type:complete
MKSKKEKYLTYLNDNYFYEIGYLRKESKLKNIEMKKQYRNNQGRSPRQKEQTYQTLKLAFILFVISMSAYGLISIWI